MLGTRTIAHGLDGRLGPPTAQPRTARGATCPPCSGNCRQGRACPAPVP